MNTEKKPAENAADKPTRDDVHEQREVGQKVPGIVHKIPSIDEDVARAEGEGMGQIQAKPDEGCSAGATKGPSPGSNATAGQKQS